MVNLDAIKIRNNMAKRDSRASRPITEYIILTDVPRMITEIEELRKICNSHAYTKFLLQKRERDYYE